MRPHALVILLSLLSCAPTRYTTSTTQTSANALDCALNFGINKGYTPTAGGTNGGFIRLERRVNATLELGGRATDVLTVMVSQAQLHIEATGFNSKGEELGASGRVKREASELLQRCGGEGSKG
jgi:hypothetical protein